MARQVVIHIAASLLVLIVPAIPAASGAPGDEAAELSCQRVALLDAATGEAIEGAEDLAVDREGGRLFVSAYDRWAVEDAVEANAPELPQGGIYAVEFQDIAQAGDSVALTGLTAGVEGALHPHGIGFYHGGERRRLFAINHAYGRVEGKWRKQTRVDVFDVLKDALEPVGRVEGEGLCNANDVTPLSGEMALVTRDRDACGGLRRLSETLLGLKRGEVVLAALKGEGPTGEEAETETGTVETLLDGIAFANGIALSPEGRTLAVAATRAQSVHLYDPAALLAGEAALKDTVAVEGGPDNLSWGAGGQLFAAVHPSLLRSGMARHRWFGQDRAPSRLVEIAPGEGAARTLFDDPDGARLNMATSVVEAQGTAETERMVIAAGVLDNAVLVCKPRSR